MLSASAPPQMPLQKCPCCGSEWFRQAAFHEFVPRPIPTYVLVTAQALGTVDAITAGLYREPRGAEMTLLVCLCGYILPPPVNAVRGQTPQAKQKLRDALKVVEAWSYQVREQAMALLTSGGVAHAELEALQPGMRKLEGAAAKRLAAEEVAAGRRDARGRPWQPPALQGDPQLKNRAWLESRIRTAGLTARQAKAVLRAVLAAIRKGLQPPDGKVQTPLGTFYSRWRGGSRGSRHYGRRPAFRPAFAVPPGHHLMFKAGFKLDDSQGAQNDANTQPPA
jgi:hypothetical protein